MSEPDKDEEQDEEQPEDCCPVPDDILRQPVENLPDE